LCNQIITLYELRFTNYELMSLDLIKKQKANIQKEKKKITASDVFQHPLAYQPIAKGREDATKEELGKNRKKSALDSFCALKKNADKPVCRGLKDNQTNLENFKITPDKDATNLFFSNLKPSVSGKRGGHVSDIFAPNKSQLGRKAKKKDVPQFRSSFVPEQSYPGYNGKTTLMVKVNNSLQRYNNGEEVELKDRLGDLEMDLPHYDKGDIYSAKNQEESCRVTELPSYQEGPEHSKPRNSSRNRKPFPEQSRRVDNSSTLKSNPYGTTVKLSFVKPDFNVKLAVTREPVLETVMVEEEEEEDTNNGIPDTQYPMPNESFNEIPNYKAEPQNIGRIPARAQNNEFYDHPAPIQEISSQRSVVADLKDRSGRNVPIKIDEPAFLPTSQAGARAMADEEEEEVMSFTRDYRPATDYYTPSLVTKSNIETNRSSTFLPKVKKIWNQIKINTFTPKEPAKINFQYHSGKPAWLASPENSEERRPTGKEYEPAETTFTPLKKQVAKETNRPSWKQKIFTRQEERVIENSLSYTRGFKHKLFGFRTENAKRSATILAVGIIVALMIPIGAYVQKIIEAKNSIESKSDKALNEVQSAKSAMLSAKPEEARKNFETAYQDFLSASDSLDEVGGGMLAIIKVLPGGSKIESGQNILEAGKHLTSAGQIISEAFSLFLGDQGALKKNFISTDNLSSLKEATSFAPLERRDKAQTLTEAIIMFQEKLEKAKEELAQANDSLGKVDIDDVPENKRESFQKLKNQLPGAVNSINSFSNYSNVILNVLGHNQSKQYLFLFENNDELRATGGFIGTYGIMKIEEGNISHLAIDGIYNPDGQLKERVIPPKPIQKMSATWSMHDANWWPDFPKSAEKIAWFYEKTGGPSVDGVFALTPKIMEDFLKITGPINHEKYGVTINSDNFVELTQYKVEKDYDKQLNRPKQILADLAPLVLEKIMSAPPEKWIDVLGVFSENLERREIQAYFFDSDVQKKISDLGWSGEILNTPKDYLSVVNTNISGLKTDKVIEQNIDHQTEIKPDGSIVDTVIVTRSHKGGKEKYDWYNAVNSNWMRIYVPKGSELLHAEGYTREVDSPPVDYSKLGFIEDEMVVNEESSTNTDPYTGTRVYEDSDKTVFANWTYVSPGETLTVKYSYLLPFKLRFDDLKKPADTYSLLVQKQAGDENSSLASKVIGFDGFDSIYHYPNTLPLPDWRIDEKFLKDVFAGVVLVPKGTKIE